MFSQYRLKNRVVELDYRLNYLEIGIYLDNYINSKIDLKVNILYVSFSMVKIRLMIDLESLNH